MWDVRAGFLGGALKHTRRFNKKIEEALLCLPPAEPLFGRTVAVPFIFVADDVFALPVNVMKPVEIKCQLDATEVFIADLIACSTCFGHHYAHHQELKSIIQWLPPVVFRAVVFKLLV